MNFLLVLFILHKAFVPSISLRGSFFRLLNDAQETNVAVFLQPEFFTCSMDKKCSYVIQYKKTKRFKTIKDKMELESLKEPITIWEKIQSEEGNPALTNIALNKPATLSTQYDNTTIPGNAVDGNLYSGHRSCASTKRAGHPPWFRVDLLQKAHIKSVALKNREPCCWNRMNPFDVRIGDSLKNDGRVNPKCVSGESFTTPNQYRLFECPYTMEGRYVMVFAEAAVIMELCELEVYGF